MRGAGVALLKSSASATRTLEDAVAAAPPLAAPELADAASRRVMLSRYWYWYWRGFCLVYRSAGRCAGKARRPPDARGARALRTRRRSAPKPRATTRRSRCRRPSRRCARRSSPPPISGHIEDLRVPLDWNELKPDVAARRRRRSDRLLEEDLRRRRGPRDAGRARQYPPDEAGASCRSARTSRTTSSTSGPISPRPSSTS